MAEPTALPSKKRCSHCKRVKDRSCFGVCRARGATRLQSWCNICKSAQKRTRRRIGVQLQFDLQIKHCPGCKRYKSLPDFARCALTKDGHQRYCRKCMRRNVDRWIRANRDKHNACGRRWQLANPDSKRVIDARRRARKAAAATRTFHV